jgi:hypothetical protein
MSDKPPLNGGKSNMVYRALQVSTLVFSCALFAGSSAWAEGHGEGSDNHKKNHEKNDKDNKKDDKKDNKKCEDDKKKESRWCFGHKQHPLPGPHRVFSFIIKHFEALNITEIQKKSLHEMYEAMQKVMEDTEIKDLQKQIHEVQVQLNDLHSQLREKISSKGGLTDENLKTGLNKILTVEQIEKLIQMIHDDCRHQSFKSKHCSEKFHAALKEILTPEQFVRLRAMLHADEESDKKEHDEKDNKEKKDKDDKEKKEKKEKKDK